MITPGKNAVMLAIAPAVLSLAVLASDAFLIPVLALDIVIVGIAFFDLISLPGRQHFEVERDLPGTFAIGRFYTVTLSLTSRCRRAVEIDLNDYLPDSGEARRLPARFPMAARSRMAWEYELAFHSRGQHELASAYVRVGSRFGMWSRVLTYDVPSSVTVYPDLKQITDYLLMTRRHQLSLLGIRKMQRIGGDNEFERLKEYHADDEFRHIAWKATARQGRLISRAFQMNENQSALFMLDCGRMMAGRVGEQTCLDEALNATLMLSYIALQHHDSVGVLTFADQVDSYLPPKSGREQINRIIQVTYHKHAEERASNVGAALRYVNTRRRKRTLLVLITQAIDDVTFAELKSNLRLLRTRHLPLLVLLRDREVEEMALQDPAASESAFYEAAAAAEFVAWRRQHIDDLRTSGIHCLDALPEELTADLINRYLTIKARHLL
jgi:uncharacterized protein (DUF58 family)